MTIEWRMCAMALFFTAGAAQADDAAMPMKPSHSKHHKTSTESPSNAAFAGSMDTMMRAMSIAPTGNPDRDFVRMMLPHHQGAIDMAKVELQYGKDPMLRKLAEDIIKAQQPEIAEMNGWLAGRPQ